MEIVESDEEKDDDEMLGNQNVVDMPVASVLSAIQRSGEESVALLLHPEIAKTCLDIKVEELPLGLEDVAYYKQVSRLKSKSTVVLTKTIAQNKHYPAGWIKAWNEAKEAIIRRSLLMQSWWQTEATAHGVDTHLASARQLEQPGRGKVYTNDEYQPSDGVCAISVVKIDCLSVASAVSSSDGLKVAVVVPCSSSPGGGVAIGAFSFEAEVYRRTDICRSVETYIKGGTRYPINVDNNHTLVHQDVALMRGPVNVGLPFLEDRSHLTTIMIGMNAHPPTSDDAEPRYRDAVQRVTLEKKIRMVFSSAISTGCNTVVMPPFGCIDFFHPAHEVSQVLLKEVKKLGGCLKHVIIAVPDEHDQRSQSNPQGNHDFFRQVLCPDQVEIQGGAADVKSPQYADVDLSSASSSKEKQPESGGDVVLRTASPPEQFGDSESLVRFGSASLESSAASTKLDDAALARDEPMHQASAEQHSVSETPPLAVEASSPVGGVLSTSSASDAEALTRKEQARRDKYSSDSLADFPKEKSIGQLV